MHFMVLEGSDPPETLLSHCNEPAFIKMWKWLYKYSLVLIIHLETNNTGNFSAMRVIYCLYLVK